MRLHIFIDVSVVFFFHLFDNVCAASACARKAKTSTHMFNTMIRLYSFGTESTIFLRKCKNTNILVTAVICKENNETLIPFWAFWA